MKKNKYLDRIGIRRENYGANFIKGRKVQRFIERLRYGFDYRDTVNMEMRTAEWLYSRLKMLTEKTMDDLTYNHVEFEGRTYTIEEAFDRIMNACKEFLLSCQNGDFYLEPDEHEEAERIYEELQASVRLWSVVMAYADITLVSRRTLRRWERGI